jgi:hypothetical protein
MWLCLSESFISIVHNHCAEDELLVRARRKGDIEKIFPGAKVNEYPEHDYLYASVIKRHLVAKAIAGQVSRIDYPQFKPSVKDDQLRQVYFQTWAALSWLQSQ